MTLQSKHTMKRFALFEFFLQRRKAVYLVILLLVGAGITSFRDAPKEGQPNIDIPIAYASFSYRGASPDEVDRLILSPVMDHVKNLSHLKYAETRAREGNGVVVMYYEDGQDINDLYGDFKDAIDDAKNDIPDNVDVYVSKVNISEDDPLVDVNLRGDDLAALNDVAASIKEEGRGITGVSDVKVHGERTKAVLLYFNSGAMESYGISVGDVSRAIKNGNVLVPSGVLDTGSGRLNLKISNPVVTAEDIAALPLRSDAKGTSVRISDVALVSVQYRELTSKSRENGRPIISITFTGQPGSNQIEASNDVFKLLDRYVEEKGIQYNYVGGMAQVVEKIFSSLTNTLFVSSLLVAIVILISLGSSAGFLVAWVIPMSSLITFTIIYSSGISINIMVLFGLLMTSGMVVDGAIVVTEYAEKRIYEGHGREAAYSDALSRMFWPVTGGLMTTVAVYVPLFFWPGIAGQFMRYLIMTVPLSLIISIFVVFFLLPIIGVKLTSPSPEFIEKKEKTTLALRLYKKLLSISLRFPKRMIAFFLLVCVLALLIFLTFKRGTIFLANISPDTVDLSVYSDKPYSLEQREEVVAPIEAKVLKDTTFKTITSQITLTSSQSGRAGRIAKFSMRVADGLRVTAEEVRDRLKKEFNSDNYPDLSFSMRLTNSVLNVGHPKQAQIEAVVSGVYYDKVTELVKNVTKALKKYGKSSGMFTNVGNSLPQSHTEQIVSVRRDRLAYYGVSMMEISNWLSLFAEGGVRLESDFRLKGETDTVEVLGYFPKSERRNWSKIQTLLIPTPRGKVPLSEFLKTGYGNSSTYILRRDGKVRTTVYADVGDSERYSSSQAYDKMVEYFNTPEIKSQFDAAGATFEQGGDADDQNSSASFLQKAFFIGVGLILLILLLQFNSWFAAAVILSAVIFSVFGALLGVLVGSRELSVVMFGLGVLSLAGIVVNNNIVLIDEFFNRLKDGHSAREAAELAATSRFRPVSLTAITTAISLLPAFFVLSPDILHFKVVHNEATSEIFLQLSRVTVVGFCFTSIITLLVTPALLTLYRLPKSGVPAESSIMRFFKKITSRRMRT